MWALEPSGTSIHRHWPKRWIHEIRWELRSLEKDGVTIDFDFRRLAMRKGRFPRGGCINSKSLVVTVGCQVRQLPLQLFDSVVGDVRAGDAEYRELA